MRAPNQRHSKAPSDRRSHHPPPTPTPTFNPWAHPPPPPQTRDSDASHASYASSLPHPPSAIATINHYLSSTLSLPPIKTPLSTKDTSLFRHLLLHLSLPLSPKPEDDLSLLLKSLNCPHKFNKSALRAPGEKRASAMLISILHWLVQLCQYNDALLARPFMDGNGMFLYVRDCYGFYMEGDDDSVAALDEELLGKLEAQRDGIREDCRAIEGEIRAMEERLEGFKSRPSRVVELEKEEKVVEEEIKKLKEIVEQFTKDVVGMEKWVQDKEKELEDKMEANRNICEENEEIEKRVKEQLINANDAKRMKCELDSLEEDIKASKQARNDKEGEVWKFTSDIGKMLRKLEELRDKCNQAVRRFSSVLSHCLYLLYII